MRKSIGLPATRETFIPEEMGAPFHTAWWQT